MSILRVGQWGTAKRILKTGAARIDIAARKVTASEAKFFAEKIREGLEKQAPGDKPFAAGPPSETTLISREFKGLSSTKSLVVRRDLKNAIKHVSKGNFAFAGVFKGAKGSNGQELSRVAELNENGRKGIVIEVTPKMRRFLAIMFKGKNADNQSTGSTGVIIVNIPARPFIEPVFKKYGTGAAAAARVVRKFSLFTAFMFGK